MLILTRRVGETLMIGDDVTVTVLGVKGNQVRIGVNAPRDVSVHREEIYERIKKEQSEKRLTPVLDRIRRLGYAERSHDLDPETTTLAKPIMTSKRVMATIGITFFKGAGANRKEIVAALGEAANEIGELADSST